MLDKAFQVMTCIFHALPHLASCFIFGDHVSLFHPLGSVPPAALYTSNVQLTVHAV